MLTAVLLPFAVQLVHSFEHHEHVCSAQNKSHFDSHEFECSVFHFHINNQSSNLTGFYYYIVKASSIEKNIFFEAEFQSFKTTYKSSRAPPTSLI